MNTEAEKALEPYRRYIDVLARVHLDTRLRGKMDPSDITQQVFLRAYAAWDLLVDKEPPVIIAWLRKILARMLSDAVKHFERDKRDIDLEQMVAAQLDQSSASMAGWLVANQTSPSQAAIKNEELLKLAEALGQLEEPFREAIVLKHLRNWTLPQIAEHLGKSIPSVAGYLRRGLEQLRKKIEE